MAARITVNLNAKGAFEIWLNPEGRDVLVKELQGLSETNDHFHLDLLARYKSLAAVIGQTISF